VIVGFKGFKSIKVQKSSRVQKGSTFEQNNFELLNAEGDEGNVTYDSMGNSAKCIVQSA
jgi:hypothetical protein